MAEVSDGRDPRPRSEFVDGRTARRDRNREAVLDAVIELFGEGNLNPGVHEVADRSGVSLRSVYRYFEHVDALLVSAINRQFERARPLRRISAIGEGSLDGRIARLVDNRVVFFEKVRVVLRAAALHQLVDGEIGAGMHRLRANLAEQTARMFSPELDGDDRGHLAVTVDVLLQFDSLELLHSVHGLEGDALRGYLHDALSSLLALRVAS